MIAVKNFQENSVDIVIPLRKRMLLDYAQFRVYSDEVDMADVNFCINRAQYFTSKNLLDIGWCWVRLGKIIVASLENKLIRR